MLERCISRSVPGSMIPVMYGNNYQIIQTPGYIVITYEIVHEARVIPLDGRPHRRRRRARAHGRSARPLGGQHARRRDDQLHERGGLSRRQRRHFRVIERFTRVAPDRIEWTATLDDPEDLDQAVDDRHAAHGRSASDPGLRVPRAQLRTQKHPQRGSSGGTQ